MSKGQIKMETRVKWQPEERGKEGGGQEGFYPSLSKRTEKKKQWESPRGRESRQEAKRGEGSRRRKEGTRRDNSSWLGKGGRGETESERSGRVYNKSSR